MPLLSVLGWSAFAVAALLAVIFALRAHLARTEAAAGRAAEALFNAVVRGSPIGLLLVDSTGAIQLANPEAARIFGVDAGELERVNVDTLVPPEVRDRHPELRAKYGAAPSVRELFSSSELHGMRRDGTRIPVAVSLAPVRVDGETLVVCSVIDVTRRRDAERALSIANQELEQRVTSRTAELRAANEELGLANDALQDLNGQLQRSNEELEQFAYVASHDLQEPLRSVSGYVQLLARRYRGKLDADADEFIRHSVEGAERMRHLIEDLLMYSRVGTRGRPLERTALDEVFADVQSDLQRRIEETGATIECEPLPAVRADALQMRQLLQNLLQNALKFRRGDTPPVVRVTARGGATVWRIAVQDNGIGLDPQYADRIFKIFQRLNLREEFEGTGIGLAVCRRIVQRHGGEIGVDSVPGEGATFWFTLPRSGPDRTSRRLLPVEPELEPKDTA